MSFTNRTLKNFILLWGLLIFVGGCGNGRTAPNPPSQANTGDAAQQAHALATQAAAVVADQENVIATGAAAAVVAQTDAAATPAADLIANEGEALATQAADLVAEGSATLVAQGEQLLEEAAVTLESGDVPATLVPGSLAEKFATVPLPGEDGTVEVTITDDELNQAIAAGQSAQAQTGTPAVIQNPQVVFTGGYIVFSGTISEPVSGLLTVTFAPYVVDGTLQLDVVEASVGNLRVPPTVLQTAEQTLNSTLNEAMSQLPEGIGLQSVTVGEGVMTVVVAKV